MKNMKTQLVELLSIHGVSGQEKPVRDYLIVELAGLVDKMEVDNYGNLLAIKKVGNGKGATVLLSAHMDTVRAVLKNRELIEKDGIISSSAGALGADDRAGIAIILTVLRNIETTLFNGTIKIAFSVEEEIGAVGASYIDKKFYSDANLAIVIDRRGNRDIVVGCSRAFCSDSVGNFMENVSKMCDMDWKCVEGGISDTMIFAENGINAINLSAGYMNEHTSQEWVSLKDMRDTMKLVMQTLVVINQFYGTFTKAESENKWLRKSSRYNKSNKYSSYFENDITNDIWIEKEDVNGSVLIYEVGGDIVISQSGNEIVLSRQNFLYLINESRAQLN